MRGYLKGAGIIHQCTRCYALRNVVEAPGECLSCRKLLNISHNEVRPLVLGDISNDVMPIVEYTTGRGAA